MRETYQVPLYALGRPANARRAFVTT
jgi:hypothetical protein